MDNRYRFASVPAKINPVLMREQIGGYLLAAHRAASAENRQKVCNYLDQNELDYSSDNIKAAIQTLGPALSLAIQKIKPMPRTVSVEKLQDMLAQILNANPWIADTVRNGQIIGEAFLNDAPPTRTLQDLVDTVKRISGRLERYVPPPPPVPQFEETLESW